MTDRTSRENYGAALVVVVSGLLMVAGGFLSTHPDAVLVGTALGGGIAGMGVMLAVETWIARRRARQVVEDQSLESILRRVSRDGRP